MHQFCHLIFSVITIRGLCSIWELLFTQSSYRIIPIRDDAVPFFQFRKTELFIIAIEDRLSIRIGETSSLSCFPIRIGYFPSVRVLYLFCPSQCIRSDLCASQPVLYLCQLSEWIIGQLHFPSVCVLDTG